jgi:hypothetical protein
MQGSHVRHRFAMVFSNLLLPRELHGVRVFCENL